MDQSKVGRLYPGEAIRWTHLAGLVFWCWGRPSSFGGRGGKPLKILAKGLIIFYNYRNVRNEGIKREKSDGSVENRGWQACAP